MKPLIKIGDPTPWGTATHVSDLSQGCSMVIAGDAGGLHISDKIKKQMAPESRPIVFTEPDWPEHWVEENFNMPIAMSLIFRYLDKQTLVSTFRHDEQYIHHAFWANLGLGVARCFPVTYEPLIPILENIARKASSTQYRGYVHHINQK